MATFPGGMNENDYNQWYQSALKSYGGKADALTNAGYTPTGLAGSDSDTQSGTNVSGNSLYQSAAANFNQPTSLGSTQLVKNTAVQLQQNGQTIGTMQGQQLGKTQQDVANALGSDYSQSVSANNMLNQAQDEARQDSGAAPQQILDRADQVAQQSRNQVNQAVTGREQSSLGDVTAAQAAAKQLGPNAQARSSTINSQVAGMAQSDLGQFKDTTAQSIENSRNGVEASFEQQKSNLVAQFGNDTEGLNNALRTLQGQKQTALGNIAIQASMAYNTTASQNRQFWGNLASQTSTTLAQYEGLAESQGAQLETQLASLSQSIRSNAANLIAQNEQGILNLQNTATSLYGSALESHVSTLQNMQAFLTPMAPYVSSMYELAQGQMQGNVADQSGGGGGQYGVGLTGGSDSQSGGYAGTNGAGGSGTDGGRYDPTLQNPVPDSSGSTSGESGYGQEISQNAAMGFGTAGYSSVDQSRTNPDANYVSEADARATSQRLSKSGLDVPKTAKGYVSQPGQF